MTEFQCMTCKHAALAIVSGGSAWVCTKHNYSVDGACAFLVMSHTDSFDCPEREPFKKATPIRYLSNIGSNLYCFEGEPKVTDGFGNPFKEEDDD